MNKTPHVETTPELPTEQAADLAELERLVEEVEVPASVSDSPEVQEPATIPTQALIMPLVTMFCASVAPAWAITQDEQVILSESYALVVDKYFPDGVPMGVEVGAIMATAAIVMPRLGKPLKVEPKSDGKADENK